MMRRESAYNVFRVCESCAQSFHVLVWAKDSKEAKERPIMVKRCPRCIEEGHGNEHAGRTG
jgi:hypothetical protein